MIITHEKKKVLLDVLSNGFSALADLRQQYKPVISTDVSRTLEKDLNNQMVASLHLKELISVINVDTDFMLGIHPESFKILQGFLNRQIKDLNKQIQDISKTDPDLFQLVNSFFEERIAFIEEIKEDLTTMREYCEPVI